METCFSDQFSSLCPNSLWGNQEHYPAVSDRQLQQSSDITALHESACATNYNGCGSLPPSDVYSQIPSQQVGGGVELPSLRKSGDGFQCSSELQSGWFSGNLGYDHMKGINQYHQSVVGEDGNQVVPEYSAAVAAAAAAADPTVCDINLSKSNKYKGSWIYDGQGLQISRKTAASAASAENGIRVGKYSVEERKGKILRYLNKRNRRNFNKTIKYACRKTLADRRTRVRGRFAKNNNELYAAGGELKDENSGRHHLDEKLSASSISSQDELCDFYNVYDSEVKLLQDGEDWIQEAIRCLFYNTTPPYSNNNNNIPPWQDGVAL